MHAGSPGPLPMSKIALASGFTFFTLSRVIIHASAAWLKNFMYGSTMSASNEPFDICRAGGPFRAVERATALVLRKIERSSIKVASLVPLFRRIWRLRSYPGATGSFFLFSFFFLLDSREKRARAWHVCAPLLTFNFSTKLFTFMKSRAITNKSLHARYQRAAGPFDLGWAPISGRIEAQARQAGTFCYSVA